MKKYALAAIALTAISSTALAEDKADLNIDVYMEIPKFISVDITGFDVIFDEVEETDVLGLGKKKVAEQSFTLKGNVRNVKAVLKANNELYTYNNQYVIAQVSEKPAGGEFIDRIPVEVQLGIDATNKGSFRPNTPIPYDSLTLNKDHNANMSFTVYSNDYGSAKAGNYTGVYTLALEAM